MDFALKQALGTPVPARQEEAYTLPTELPREATFIQKIAEKRS